MSTTEQTERIAKRYFAAWTSRDNKTTASCLADDFTFAAGDMKLSGRDAFLNANAFPSGAVTKMVADAYQGDRAFQMYDSTNGKKTVRIVEQLTIRDGVIVSSTFVSDMSALQAFMQG